MPAKDPTKLVSDLQPTVRKCTTVPSKLHHSAKPNSLCPEYGAEECARFQVIPPYLTVNIICLALF